VNIACFLSHLKYLSLLNLCQLILNEEKHGNKNTLGDTALNGKRID
jgi:5-methylcytosine-specific restriction endonuclease McrBC regulatory subunit McrC